MVRAFLVPQGSKGSHEERAEVPRGCSKAVAPGRTVGCSSHRRGQWGDLGHFCLTLLPPAKLDLGARRNDCIYGW